MSQITESFDELKSEAKDLGVEITGLKSKKDVKAAIDAHYANQSADGLVEAVEEAETEAEDAETVEDTQEPEVEAPIEMKSTGKKAKATQGYTGQTYKEILEMKPDFSAMSKVQAKNESLKYHALLKQYWMGKRVVTITNNDKRENAHATMAFLSAGVIQRQVPLDIPVEIERCLIKVAQDLTITSHIDEVINGVRTGNKTPIVVKKYGVSIQDNEL